jgi:hypothetical protein
MLDDGLKEAIAHTLKRKSMFSVLAIVLFGHSIVSAGQQVAIYGDSNYPPYSYVEMVNQKGSM